MADHDVVIMDSRKRGGIVGSNATWTVASPYLARLLIRLQPLSLIAPKVGRIQPAGVQLVHLQMTILKGRFIHCINNCRLEPSFYRCKHTLNEPTS